jgi:hypothetical protein
MTFAPLNRTIATNLSVIFALVLKPQAYLVGRRFRYQ